MHPTCPGPMAAVSSLLAWRPGPPNGMLPKRQYSWDSNSASDGNPHPVLVWVSWDTEPQGAAAGLGELGGGLAPMAPSMVRSHSFWAPDPPGPHTTCPFLANCKNNHLNKKRGIFASIFVDWLFYSYKDLQDLQLCSSSSPSSILTTAQGGKTKQ